MTKKKIWEIGDYFIYYNCEYVYIYDQDSDDGSKEVYKNYPNLIVVESKTNDFKNEIFCKDILLKKLLEEQPDTDFIFWLDGDSLIDNNLVKNNNLIYNIGWASRYFFRMSYFSSFHPVVKGKMGKLKKFPTARFCVPTLTNFCAVFQMSTHKVQNKSPLFSTSLFKAASSALSTSTHHSPQASDY